MPPLAPVTMITFPSIFMRAHSFASRFFELFPLPDQSGTREGLLSAGHAPARRRQSRYRRLR